MTDIRHVLLGKDTIAEPNSNLHGNELNSVPQNAASESGTHIQEIFKLRRKGKAQLHKEMAAALPGLIPSDLAHDALHPHQVLSHHWEELHLVRYWSDLDSTGLTRTQQLLPRLHHLLLSHHDGLSFLPSIDGPQLRSVFLQLPHLQQDRTILRWWV